VVVGAPCGPKLRAGARKAVDDISSEVFHGLFLSGKDSWTTKTDGNSPA